MAYDSSYSVHLGDKFLVDIALPALTGLLLTIQGTPTVTLKDGEGAVVWGPVNATGFDAAEAAQPHVWHVLDTLSPTALTPGLYVAAVTVSFDDDATPPRSYTEELAAKIMVLAQVEIEFTYDPAQILTDPFHACRLYLADTDAANPIFDDREIIGFLSDPQANPQGNLYLAVANGYLVNAGDKAKIAARIRIGSFGYEEQQVHRALIDVSNEWRKKAAPTPKVSVPDVVLTLNSGNGTIQGLDW